jgi:asparagine synthase (glutamine-hydrolysing)
LRNQLASFPLPFEPPYEKRYPYLDRDLLEFLFALPPEQLLRPNERRSLMRRALRQILPDEILTRRRKAFVTRHPLPQRPSQWTALHKFAGNLHPATRQVIDSTAFDEALTNAEYGREVPLIPLLRTVALDLWLRSISELTTREKNVPGPRLIEGMYGESRRTVSQLRTTH